MRGELHKRIMIILIGAVMFLIVFHIALQYREHVAGTITRLEIGRFSADVTFWFDLNTERKVGAIFSTGLLAACGLLMLYSAFLERNQSTAAIGWVLFACILLYMAGDEFFQLHERSGALIGMKGKFGDHVVPGWVRVMAIVVTLLCILMSYFWWKLPIDLRVRLFIAAIVFLTGAMGIEIISSAYVMKHGPDNFAYAKLAALEEGLEMIGVLIVIDSMLLHIGNLSTRKREGERGLST
ncbi:hypothetical protein [Ruegeria sp. AU67]|uniref:hypothetical protein n=1 Tax=Ruegeria sp. AU67 TaxID=2108530 RepID=UPI000D692A70|nr:hypothetical protein [Ruegeria sp. AU67]